jgi:hypothetical protein
MKQSQFALLGGFFAAISCFSASVATQPGTVNYIEGEASIASQSLSQNSVGSAKLGMGQSVTTQNGKVEILLTPGIFFRLGDDSSAQMISPGLANTVLTLVKGRAMVEVDLILPENNVRINEGLASTRLMKAGLYDFDADRGQLRVFDGLVLVQTAGQQIKVKGGQELILSATGKLKPKRFDRKAFEDDFYRWASLRSSYISEANVDTARLYAGAGGSYGQGWLGDGWYWDPFFDAYTFIPGDGIFFSPFGWGYYSPWYAYGAPYFGYGGFYHHFWPGYRPRYSAVGRGLGFNGHASNVGRGTVGGFSPRGTLLGGGPNRSVGFHAGGSGSFHGSGGGGSHGGGGGHR